jgi:exopolysaccharide biosynthesis protein
MTLRELAEELISLGAFEALNLDGGGSTTIVVRGAVRNSPSDGSERPVSDAILVFSPQGPDAVKRARNRPAVLN